MSATYTSDDDDDDCDRPGLLLGQDPRHLYSATLSEKEQPENSSSTSEEVGQSVRVEVARGHRSLGFG